MIMHWGLFELHIAVSSNDLMHVRSSDRDIQKGPASALDRSHIIDFKSLTRLGHSWLQVEQKHLRTPLLFD
jgi:hypothetical protein